MANGGHVHEEPVKAEDRRKSKPEKKPAGTKGDKVAKSA
jgi:hypothetical protein